MREQTMKEDAVQMVVLADATQASGRWWSAGQDDTHPVISRTGLSEVYVEPMQQAINEHGPTALGWAQEEPPGGEFLDNSTQLETNPFAIWNVTREYPFECAMIMFGYIMPFVLVITLVTNFLVIVVLSQRHMRTPTNIVLMTMSIVDIGTISFPSPWYLYIYTFGNHEKFLYPPVTCYIHYVMTDVIPIFLHTSSIWLALLLASQRYIYVCHPTLARNWCTKPRVKKAIYTILLVALLHQSTHFFDNVFKPTRVLQKGTIQPACRNEMAPWLSELGDNYYYFTYFTFRIFFVFIMPCTALLTLNILLFRALRRAEKKRTELLRRKFKLVGAAGAESLQHAANSQRPNNFSTYEPSSYALTGRFASERHKPTSHMEADGPTRKQNLEAVIAMGGGGGGGGVGDNQSCESMSQFSDGVATRVRKSRSQSVDLEAAESRPSLSSTKPEDDDDDDESEVGDESTCAECAALRRQADSPACRRCSLDETETTTARERHQHHHQSSQCSSIMGAATNEEDVSSLTTNHQHRCPNGSMFGQSETCERRLTNDSDEEAELNLSLNSSSSSNSSASESADQSVLAEKLKLDEQQSAALGKELVTQKMDELELIKSSSSAESKLAQCGCLKAHTRAMRRVRLLSKNKPKSDNSQSGCLNLCAGKSPKKTTNKARLWDRASSKTPASQPTICTTPGGPQDIGELNDNDKLAISTRSGHEPQRPHSIHSLVQVRVESQQQEANNNSERRTSDSNNRLFAPTGRRTKSPSFASSIGRASRASLAGSSATAAMPLAPLASTVGHPQQSGRTMDSNRTTLMLIVVVTVFLIVEVPVAVVTIIHVVINSLDVFRNVDINNTLNYIKLFTNFFIMLSYSINFTIYCSMSKKFRETFRDIFCWGRFKRKRSARMMYQTQAQPNEFGTVTQAHGGFGGGGGGGISGLVPQRQLASPTGHHQTAEARPLVGANRAHQRSNSLKPAQREAAAAAAGHEPDRLQCGSAIYSDYLATATTTLTTLDTRGSTAGQQQHATTNGRAGDNTSASASPSNSSISSTPKAAQKMARRMSPPALISSTAAAIKQRCKSLLNGGQVALPSPPRCQL